MRVSCCVAGCNSNRTPSIREEGEVSVFSFPTNREKNENWLRAIPGKIIKKKNMRICIKHFDESMIKSHYDYVKHTSDRKTLTNDAIPTIFNLFPKHLPKKIPRQPIDQMEQKSRSENDMFLQEIVNDQIKTFANLKANIKSKVQSPEFSTLITEKNVFLYKLCYNSKRGLFVALAFSIDEHLIISIYEKNYQHKPGDFKGIMRNDGKLFFYSQIQKLMDRCPKIKCLQSQEAIKPPTVEKIFIEEDNILKEKCVNEERTEKIIFTI